ncbi:MAG: flagellin [SAR324 cluster bacterium]|nr:flagellin [SAR324 cluster bacterium]
MVLRINQNISAINAQRQLAINDRALSKSLERLASAQRINRASDGPASLIISEQMRAQIAGLNQAIDNSETAVGMVQTTEAALIEVTNLLTNLRQLAIASANEGANDANMLEANQLEMENALNTIDRITRNAQFGVKKLLDGSTGANGVAIGDQLEFITAAPETRASPTEGYDVRVQQLATRSSLTGSEELTQEMVDAGEKLIISEGGRTVSFITKPGDTVEQTFGKLRNEIEKNDLDINLTVDNSGRLQLQHNKFGSEHTFSTASATAGVLSEESRVMQSADLGQDIRGTIGRDVAVGTGQVLTGAAGTRTQGLAVRYRGSVTTDADAGEGAESAGRVAVFQNSLIFQVGPNVGQTVAVSMVNTNTRVLGNGVDNVSGFKSLRDLDLRSAQGAEDAQKIVDKAINEANVTRAALGAFQKNTLEANLRQLRINSQELTNAQSIIRDADMAKEITDFTRNQIMMQSATAMLAQANQVPKTILTLLG